MILTGTSLRPRTCGGSRPRFVTIGLEVLGYYHSHPDHPAVPSAFDMEHAWPWYSYIIVQVNRGGAAELASWVLEDDRSSMQPESVSVLTEV